MRRRGATNQQEGFGIKRRLPSGRGSPMGIRCDGPSSGLAWRYTTTVAWRACVAVAVAVGLEQGMVGAGGPREALFHP